MRLAHTRFKRRKTNFSQRPLIHNCIQVVPIVFGVIGHKVLHGCDNTLRLHPLNETDSGSRGEIRVFTEVLEISPVQWRTVDVDPGGEKYPYAPCPCISGHAPS